MHKPNPYRIRFGTRSGTFCGLHFTDGISKETVEGPRDWKFKRLRGIWGASRISLVPVENAIEGAAAPVAASAAGAAAPSSSSVLMQRAPETLPGKPVGGPGAPEFVEKMRAAKMKKNGGK